MRRRHDAGAPSSDFNKNVKFYFQIHHRHHRVAPIVHVPCHRRARLPSSRVPCRFSIDLLFPRFSTTLLRGVSRSVRCMSPSVSSSFPSWKTDRNRDQSFNLLAYYFRDAISRHVRSLATTLRYV